MHNIDRVEAVFDRQALARICTMSERKFAAAFDMETWRCDQPAPEDFYHFRDHGSNILAVAHLDTVADARSRQCHFIDSAGGPVVYSRALDDRLGAYVILDMLPKLGIQHDILLTTGEESGRSTASFFDAPRGKDYDWIIEFDRGGTDVVLYQYDDDDTRARVRKAGARVGDGSFSDISYLEHLQIKAFNWGVGYRDYHGPRAHAYLDDTFDMVAKYLTFYRQNKDTYMPHTIKPEPKWWDAEPSGSAIWDDDVLVPADPHEDIFDADFSEYPTLEELQAFEERLAREQERNRHREDEHLYADYLSSIDR